MAEVSNQIVDRRRLLHWIAVPLVLLVVAFGLSVYAFAIHASAKSILKDVSALRVGVSSIAEVEALAARHQGTLRERHCDNQKCIVSFEVYNTWLYRLKLEPIARFRASVEADGGTVNFIEVILSRDTGAFPTSPSAGITEEYLNVPKRMGNVSTPYWFPTPVGKPYLRVALTSQANVVERQHAYAYSLRCLIKLGGGCDLPCDYLPVAWHDWEAELEKHGFGVGGFGGYYPNRKRCR
jgi:hypothetical protein